MNTNNTYHATLTNVTSSEELYYEILEIINKARKAGAKRIQLVTNKAAREFSQNVIKDMRSSYESDYDEPWIYIQLVSPNGTKVERPQNLLRISRPEECLALLHEHGDNALTVMITLAQNQARRLEKDRILITWSSKEGVDACRNLCKELRLSALETRKATVEELEGKISRARSAAKKEDYAKLLSIINRIPVWIFVESKVANVCK